MITLGLSGYKSAGKNTIATILTSQYGFHEFAFADKIKRVVCEILGITPEELELLKREVINWRGKEIHGRDLVRGIGMLMRSYDEDQFVKDVVERSLECNNIVLTDVRFDNEIKFIREADNGIIVYVERPGIVTDGHVSEDLERIKRQADFVITNKGEVRDLQAPVTHLINFLQNHKGIEL
jgi:hypothetical protein